jgi:hypothetical protein
MIPALYLFEFCDQHWVPAGARECLFEIMDVCNSGLRSFNNRVADAAIALAREAGFDTIVELGAGRAPVTTSLAERSESAGLRLVPCDLTPNEAVYQDLAGRYPDRVEPIYTPVDITEPQNAFNSSVLILAGMMHHIPFGIRFAVIKALSESHSRIAMFEPLKRTPMSIFLTTLAVFPSLWLPITFIRRPGRLRRFFWCWLLPIVPAMFVWDGVTSCLRQWTPREWQEVFARLGDNANHVEIQSGFHSLVITWSGAGQE